jgi:hypothetical protein
MSRYAHELVKVDDVTKIILDIKHGTMIVTKTYYVKVEPRFVDKVMRNIPCITFDAIDNLDFDRYDNLGRSGWCVVGEKTVQMRTENVLSLTVIYPEESHKLMLCSSRNLQYIVDQRNFDLFNSRHHTFLETEGKKNV